MHDVMWHADMQMMHRKASAMAHEADNGHTALCLWRKTIHIIETMALLKSHVLGFKQWESHRVTGDFGEV